MARLAAGDPQALGELYDAHGANAYALAISMVRDPQDAEEVVSETFAQVWRTAASFDPGRASAVAWVHTIARARALDLLRSRRRRTQRLERAAQGSHEGLAVPVALPEPADREAERNELRVRVRECLALLPEPQREVVELAYFGGLSQSEIAAHLEEPLGTVKTRVRTALEKLRGALAPLRSEVDL
jgi:RNA polymerase sigma-70 factor (ECF subfamily)